MIIAGTGHRPNKLGGYDQQSFNKLVKLAEYFFSSIPNSTTIITGMALGWDQALAQACINRNIPFIAAIPCKNQWSMWNKQAIEYYQKLLSNKLCTIHNVSNLNYTYDCMQKRNQWMVDKCDQLVAIWDGSSGGTANCINYAKSQDKPYLNLYGIWTQSYK